MCARACVSDEGGGGDRGPRTRTRTRGSKWGGSRACGDPQEEGSGEGRVKGRVVASKCDPYYVWHTHISTIQECMQTANLRQNVNSWYLVTNANKF